jgi:hypothetical protein
MLLYLLSALLGGVESTYYCVEQKATFAIKCTLLRPPPPNVQFGARVFVDSGSTDVAYSSAGAKPGRDGEFCDTAVFDHYFWFGPGELEYTVKGYYADRDESYPFFFGSPTERAAGAAAPEKKKAKTESAHAAAMKAKSLGAIRIQFARVTKFLKPLPNNRTELSILTDDFADELAEKKVDATNDNITGIVWTGS